jgi:iron complex outermembrane receptor protein
MRIITAEEIRRSGARDLPGALRHVAGLHTLQTSLDYSDVNVRGYNQAFSPRLLVLVDGRQVYADYYGFTPWTTVPVELDAIRQIEIVKGPQSALFGFNAVGGVINIVTYDPLDDEASRVSVLAGTQDLVQSSAVSTWKFGQSAGLRLSAGHRTNDDFSTPLPPTDAGARRGNERFAVNVDSEFKIGDQIRAGLEVTHSDAEQTEFAPTYSLSYGEYDTRSLKANIAADTRVGLIQATAYRNEIGADVFLGDVSSPLANFRNDVIVARVESITKIGAKHTLRLSAEHRDNSLDTTTFAGAEVSYDIEALGGMWEWSALPSVTLTTAFRADRWSLERKGPIPPELGLSNADWDRSKTVPSFNVGAVWQASELDSVRILVGRGVQLPNLLNLGGQLSEFPPFGWFAGVPDLEPTVVKNYEVGWARQLSRLGAKLDVAAFRGQSRNTVANVGGFRMTPAFQFVFTPINLEKSRTTGLDISIEGRLRDAWRWGAGYIRQDIDDEFTLPSAFTLADFEHTTPRRMLKANVGWSRGPWEVDGYLHYLSSFAGFAGFDPTTGWTLAPISSHGNVDGRLGYRLNARMMLSLTAQNLARSEQRQTSAPNVERQIFATFSMTF